MHITQKASKMNKEKLKNTLIQNQELIIKELSGKIDFTHEMVDLDELDVIEPEDLSHSNEAGELNQLMLIQLQKAQRDLDTLKNMDFSPKRKVEAGAFVQTEKFNFIVGFPTIPFDFEGMHIVGVSMASPIFPFMTGKTIGEQFEFSGSKYVINHIY